MQEEQLSSQQRTISTKADEGDHPRDSLEGPLRRGGIHPRCLGPLAELRRRIPMLDM